MLLTNETPANWIAYRATVRFADGSIRAQHDFLYAADATPGQLMGRAYDIWSPARANCAGRFVDPTLTVEAVASDVREAA